MKDVKTEERSQVVHKEEIIPGVNFIGARDKGREIEKVRLHRQRDSQLGLPLSDIPRK